jgi:DNA excision repair protein ERCC-2
MIAKSIEIDLSRNSISPLIVTKGLDYTSLSTDYENRSKIEVTRAYGNLLIEMC